MSLFTTARPPKKFLAYGTRFIFLGEFDSLSAAEAAVVGHSSYCVVQTSPAYIIRHVFGIPVTVPPVIIPSGHGSLFAMRRFATFRFGE